MVSDVIDDRICSKVAARTQEVVGQERSSAQSQSRRKSRMFRTSREGSLEEQAPTGSQPIEYMEVGQ